MKRTIVISACLLCVMSMLAQAMDLPTFADRDIQGSARYVGLAGAMTALGADVSAVIDNPAALGLFRRGEVSATIDSRFDNVRTNIENVSTHDRRATVPQLSWVINFNNNRQRGLLMNNLIIQYHRIKTYNRNSAFEIGTYHSQTELMASMTEGLTEDDLLGDEAWYDTEIGWLSKIGYEGYLINPTSTGNWNAVHTAGQYLRSEIEISETGTQNEYTFGWGGNISDKWYVGASINLRTISYTKNTTYSEFFADGNDYQLLTSMTTSGIGINMAVGMVARPVDFMRIGVSVQSPTTMHLSYGNYSAITSSYSADLTYRTESESPTNSFRDKLQCAPLRTTIGVAWQISKYALISTEYDYEHLKQSDVPDMHWLKAGIEGAIKQHWFIRTGYACSTPFGKRIGNLAPDITSIRTDTEYEFMHSKQYFSFGFGWHNKNWMIDMAWQYSYMKASLFSFLGQEKAHDKYAYTNRIVLTIAWNSRR